MDRLLGRVRRKWAWHSFPLDFSSAQRRGGRNGDQLKPSEQQTVKTATSRIALACCFEHASSAVLAAGASLTETVGNDQRRQSSSRSPRHCLRHPFSAKILRADFFRGFRASAGLCNLGPHIRRRRKHHPSFWCGSLPHRVSHRRGRWFSFAISRRRYRTERVGSASVSRILWRSVFRLFGSYSRASALILLACNAPWRPQPVWRSPRWPHAAWANKLDSGRHGSGHQPHLLPLASHLDLGFRRERPASDSGFHRDPGHRRERRNRELAMACWGLGSERADQSSVAQPASIQFFPCSLGQSQIATPGTFVRLIYAVILFGAIVSPWLVRNCLVFGQAVFLRDNFWFEFSLGNYRFSNGMGWAGSIRTKIR